jgi:Cd2+/Zn2+-exporting ATPase
MACRIYVSRFTFYATRNTQHVSRFAFYVSRFPGYLASATESARRMKQAAPPSAAAEHCLVRSVAQVFEAEPALEAVKLNRAEHSLSLATLGKPDTAGIEKAVSERIKQAEGQAQCGLLRGDPDCARCLTPVPASALPRLTVEHGAETTTISRVTCPTAPTFWRWKAVPFPKIVPREVRLPDEEDHEHVWKWQLALAVLCGVFGLLAQFVLGGHAATVGYTLAYVAGAWFTLHEVWERLKHGHLDVHFLMLAVAAGSASVGAWAEGATLLFLFSLSGAMEHYAMGRTSREIRSLFKEAPKTATILDDAGREQTWPVEQLRPGMRLLLKPDEQCPVDAEVVKGATATDESNLTGEATPVEKKVGDTLLAGTLNLWGAVEATVLRPASQSALQKIIKLIKEAQHLKAPSQRLTDKFGTGYTWGILGLSLGMFFVWWLGFGHAPFVSGAAGHSAFYKTMTLLVVASPCALVLSIPSAVLAAIAFGARRGVLFRGGAAVENLAGVSVVAMDKTGTLTTGELQVDRVESFPPGREEEVARLACSLDRFSTHPLARAITRYGKQRGLELLETERVESIPGAGLQGHVSGRLVRLGKRSWIADSHLDSQIAHRGHEPGRDALPRVQADPQVGPTRFMDRAGAVVSAPATEAGHSEVWLEADGLAGRLLLRDDLRPAARPVVQRMRALGLRTVVLTGDRKATGEQLQKQLAVDEVRAELQPEQKVAAIVAFTRENHKVAMIGDGVNDAPSLAAADVGVAMGARGSDAALEQAEVVLMHDRLENFLTAFQLSRRARAVIRQNLVLSLGTVVVLVSFALAGAIPLTIGVVGHEGSTVLVVLNSLRLLFAGRSASP